MTTPSPSLPNRVLDLIDDHLELAELEGQYEMQHGQRRLGALLATGLGIVSVFALVLVSLLDALWRVGVPLFAGCLILAALVAGASYAIYREYGQRDIEAGDAFIGSRRELRRTLQWIRHRLS